MKKIYLLLAIFTLGLSSCSDFLDTNPGDALSPGTFWKTEKDIELALVGCYNGWEGADLLYRDCGSDNAYNYHKHEGWQVVGNGSMSSADTGSSFYDYWTINRCNDFLANVDRVPFRKEEVKEVYKGEVRLIRAYKYMIMTLNYGDVPLSLITYKSIEDSKIPRTPKADVEKFVLDELAAAAKVLPVEVEKTGKMTKGAALSLAMRFNLYLGHYSEALRLAKEVEELGVYELFPDFTELFLEKNRDNKETIISVQYLANEQGNGLGSLIPNGDGGWSSVVPLQGLVDAYETLDGLTIQEGKTTGSYNPVYPYANRDPRLKATVLYPGQDWDGLKALRVYDSLSPRIMNDEGKLVPNPDLHGSANNATRTGYNIKKYIAPITQYKDYWETSMNLMVLRYAEVLLTKAEAMIELNQLNDEMYAALNAVRTRAGMPEVDRIKYNSQEKLRELLRRERRVELAMEGSRRPDIIRWDIAKDVLNGKAYGCLEKAEINYDEADENKRFKFDTTADHIYIEDRVFEPYNKYLPFSQSQLDLNKKLVQNPGY